ncbi:MAG: GNAT family N-acetyltransferase [Clostridia bacterium]|nr:GNAT family N-acetyltransferase [Clostridia bacterium]
MKKENLLHIFSHMPKLETERLFLRPMRVSDAPDMFEYASDPDVTRYLLWRPHADIGHTRSYLEYLGGRYRLGMHYEWAVILKAESRMIGTCGFASIDCPNNKAEIGYVLNPRYRGQELMPEAVKRVLAFGFDVLNLHRIEARYMIGNDASRRVMEKVGMTFEGVGRDALLVKGAYRDIGTCAILANEHRQQKLKNDG